jgi:pimeloyl-ACP methyl ester carboxylesterase
MSAHILAVVVSVLVCLSAALAQQADPRPTATQSSAAQASANPAQHPDWDIAPPPLGQLVDLGGRKLHLHCTGKGSPTVIVENGSASFSIDWALVQPQVERFTRICTYDRAGFAWSDYGPTSNAVEETMDDLSLLLKAASVPPPYVLVGHSIGGLYVRAYQRRHPEDVVGMVLVDATPEADARYLVNGVDKVGIEMSYEEMKNVYAPLLKNPAPPPPLPDKVEEPLDRLPPELQRDRMWAWRKFTRESLNDSAHWWITAESWKQEFVALRRLRLSQPYILGDLPLVVLHRGRRTDAELDRREAELARMSRNGVDRIATESDHEIHLYQPELVTQAIREVVNASGKNNSLKRSPQDNQK